MRRSASPSLARAIFSIDTTDTMIDGSNRSSSSISPARAGPPRQRSALDVDEEYGRAFKSRSFLDLWSHAHRSLRHTRSSYKLSTRLSSTFKDDEVPANEEPSCSYTVLDDFALEPSPETLTHAGRKRNRRCHGRRRVEALLLEYFDVTREACEACSALLAAAGAARRHHLVLRRLLLRLDRDGSDGSNNARNALQRHVRLDNPLSPPRGRLAGFRDAHARCALLSRRLGAARRRLRRLARASRFARYAAATTIIGASAAVVLAAHAVVGVGAAAALTFYATSTTRPLPRRSTLKKLAGRFQGERRRRHERSGEEAAVDAAARGAYIVGRDLDTVSRMVRRAHDELEHGRDMSRIAVDAAGHGSDRTPLLLQEVAREEEECGEDLRCQLEELEEHACLCLLTINRSRKLVAHEMTTPDDGSPSGQTMTSQDCYSSLYRSQH